MGNSLKVESILRFLPLTAFDGLIIDVLNTGEQASILVLPHLGILGIEFLQLFFKF